MELHKIKKCTVILSTVSRIPADKTLVSTDKSYNFVEILQKKKIMTCTLYTVRPLTQPFI
jgi:hypothetical protein